MQLQDMVLTLQSEITFAICFTLRFALVIYPNQPSMFCSNLTVITAIALFLKQTDFTCLQLLHLSHLCINIFFLKRLNFQAKIHCQSIAKV